MSQNKDDFMSLWGKKATANPQASVIGGLQKQIGERDKEIEHLNQQLTTLKARLAEDVKILEESEKTINTQTSQIQELKNQLLGKGGSIGGGKLGDVPVNAQSAVAENKQLRQKVKELQDKLYVFSMLPDKISELEKKNEKLTRMIDQYEGNEKKLTDTVRKLSIGGGSEDLVLELQEKSKSQEEKIKDLETQLENANIQLMVPAEGQGAGEGDSKQVKQQLANLVSDLNKSKLQLEEEKGKRIDAEARLEVLKKTLESSKASTAQAASMALLQQELKEKTAKVGDLEKKVAELDANLQSTNTSLGATRDKTTAQEKENTSLREKISSLEAKYKDATIRFENLVESYKSKDKMPPGVDEQLRSLKERAETLSKENDTLKATRVSLENQLKEAKAAASAHSSTPLQDDLVKDLQSKLNSQKKALEQLEAEKKLLQSSASKGASEEESEKLQEEIANLKGELDIAKAQGKGGDAALRSLVSDLQTKLNQQKAEVAKLKKENVKLSSFKDAGEKMDYLEKQVSQLKEELHKARAGGAAVSSSTPASGPLSGLVSDLQSKLNASKTSIAMKENQIKELESKLRDFNAKEQIIEDKLTMSDVKLQSATKKELEWNEKLQEFESIKKKAERDAEIITQLNVQVKEKEDQLQKATLLVKDREAELQELESKVQSLREALAHK